MQRSIKFEEHYLQPPYKIEEEIKAYGDQLGQTSNVKADHTHWNCLLYTSPSPRDRQKSRMPSSA